MKIKEIINGVVVERDMTEQEIAEMEFQRKRFENNNKILELTNWFNTTYRYKDEKYNRLIVLNKLDDDGISPTVKRNELYEEAENVRLEIQRLEEELKNGN